jgi:superfamily II DNA helicase RecQ
VALIGKLGSHQLEELFGDFHAQHAAERARLQAMIHYSQSLTCRMQLLREYFGEPGGGKCNHCDNCKTPMNA